MQQGIVFKSDSFVVTSYGNGLAYELSNLGQYDSLFFQGDDAGQFKNEWEAMELADDNRPIDTIMQELYSNYRSA